MPKPKRPDTPPSTESNADLASVAARIEEIVQQIERSDVPLEQSVTLFEEGIALTRKAQQLLEAAEQRVSVLMDESLLESEGD